MPRYFFTIHRQDRVEDDRDGTYLPDADAALSYATTQSESYEKRAASDKARRIAANIAKLPELSRKP